MTEPRLLRCPDLGLMIEMQVGRKWSHVIARDAREVFVKKVSNDYLAAHTKPVAYPKGIAAAAEQFLNPALGVAKVSDEARRILTLIIEGSYQNENEHAKESGYTQIPLSVD